MLVNPRACSMQPGEFYISSAHFLGLDLQVSGFSRIMALFSTLLSDHALAVTCSGTKWWRGRGEVALPFVPSSHLFPKRVLHQNASF